MQIEGIVGPRPVSDGANQPPRLARDTTLVVQDGHGRYVEDSLRGNMFLASNSAVQALSIGSGTATGVVLSNPIGSGKNAWLMEIQVWIAAAEAAVADVGLFANVLPPAAATVHTTPLVVRPTLLGSTTASVCQADSAATLPAAPVLIRPLVGYGWVTATAQGQVGVKDEVAGAVGIAPGCTLSIQAITAVNTVLASMTWAELPV